MDTLKKLGKRIRELRRREDMTQAGLAEKCNLSNNFIAQLERGRTAPSIGTLDKLSTALRVSLAGLFEFEVRGTKQEGGERIMRKLQRIGNARDLQLLEEIVDAFSKRQK